MSYPNQTDGLGLDTLSQVNRKRLKEAFAQCTTWTPADWCMAMVGETGELANILKKVKRGDFTVEERKKEISDEFADILIYLDLWAQRVGVDLSRAVAEKFNDTSKKVGSKYYIGGDNDWHMTSTKD
jgi:NTP pyrophosphatase (non-canonical NTP hydrolase)